MERIRAIRIEQVLFCLCLVCFALSGVCLIGLFTSAVDSALSMALAGGFIGCMVLGGACFELGTV